MTGKPPSFSIELKQEAISLVLDKGYIPECPSKYVQWRWVQQLRGRGEGVLPKGQRFNVGIATNPGILGLLQAR